MRPSSASTYSRPAEPSLTGSEDHVMNITRGGIVTGWGIAVPDKVVTNDDLSVTMDTNDAWIRERTGIRERRIGGTTSQLAIEAGLAALERPDGDPTRSTR